jgi:membrane-bound lytic murein transglycosylase A
MAKILTIIFVFIISACSLTSSLTIRGKGNIKLEQVDYEEVPGWQKDEHDKALLSFLNSCEKFSVMGNSRLIGGQIGDIKVGDFRDVCDIGSAIKGTSAKQAKNFFENWFVPFRVSSKGGNSSGLFTGYYEPEIRGSRIKTDVYKYPVYARPKDLGSGSYYSRKEIEEGALEDKKLELLYVEDKVDLFFLHIQGSGRVILPDGATVKITYDGKNNQPYTSIGNYIIENNVMKGAGTSYDAIKLWLKNNPEKANEVMNVNASYIFFKITGKEYVVGAQGAPLIAERSLAIDNDIMPYGFPIWVNTKIKNRDGYNSYQKLLVAQDAGSAIKGVVRGDIFFGRGSNAERMAASMNSLGNYYIFLPVNVVDKFSGR